MFDISTLAVETTTTIELENPNGEPLLGEENKPLSITIYGPGSKPYIKAQAARNRAVLEHVRKGGKKMKDEDQREIDADFLATCTVSFNGFSYKEFTGYEMFKAAYLDPGIGFIAEQVNRNVGDWGNFTKPSVKT